MSKNSKILVDCSTW